MKKALALISAAIVIFAVAGCTNKQPEQNEAAVASGDNSSFVQESTAEESVAEPSSGHTEYSAKPTYTKRATVTTYATRATSPNHVTTSPPTTERTTVQIVVPTREATTKRAAVTKTTVPRTTALSQAATTAVSVAEPQFDYGGTLSSTAESGLTDSVKIVSHTCEPTDRQTFAIVLTVEMLEHTSENKTMYIAYNCYDKHGNRINEETLKTIVPLGEPGDTVRTVATATLDTAKIVFEQA